MTNINYLPQMLIKFTCKLFEYILLFYIKDNVKMIFNRQYILNRY